MRARIFRVNYIIHTIFWTTGLKFRDSSEKSVHMNLDPSNSLPVSLIVCCNLKSFKPMLSLFLQLQHRICLKIKYILSDKITFDFWTVCKLKLITLRSIKMIGILLLVVYLFIRSFALPYCNRDYYIASPESRFSSLKARIWMR